MTDRKPLRRSDCDHRRAMFLSGSQGISVVGSERASHRHTVTLCPDCGEFYVFGRVNGQVFDIRFVLVGDDALKAAAQYMRLLREDERE